MGDEYFGNGMVCIYDSTRRGIHNRTKVEKVWGIKKNTLTLKPPLDDILRNSEDVGEISDAIETIVDSVFDGGIFSYKLLFPENSDDETFILIMNEKRYECGYSGYDHNEQRYGLTSPQMVEFPFFYRYKCYVPDPRKISKQRTMLSYEYGIKIDNFKEAILDAFGIEFDKVIKRK